MTTFDREMTDRNFAAEYKKALFRTVLGETKALVENVIHESDRELFYAELAAWAQGMSTPQCYEGATRTESIRAFFRGFKRKK
jgi:hypothetical protein